MDDLRCQIIEAEAEVARLEAEKGVLRQDLSAAKRKLRILKASEENTQIKRKSRGERERLEVLLASNGRCERCGDKITGPFEVDHRIPLAQGGDDFGDNLRALHPACHKAKSGPEWSTTSHLKRASAKHDGTAKPSGYRWPSRKFERRAGG